MSFPGPNAVRTFEKEPLEIKDSFEIIIADKKNKLRWLNTVFRAVSGNSRDGACFKLDKQTWRRKKQWYTDDDFSKSTH